MKYCYFLTTDHTWIHFTGVDCQTRIIPSYQTDHCLVIFEFDKNTVMEQPLEITFIDHSNLAIEKFSLKLCLVGWNSSSLDINVAVSSFNNEIENLFRKYFPLKSKIVNSKNYITHG